MPPIADSNIWTLLQNPEAAHNIVLVVAMLAFAWIFASLCKVFVALLKRRSNRPFFEED